ncbi:unnamed protein product [Schistosoma turkestanicum]|nr:unnamed protein product [Schistosoma turkestanicum]
MPVSFWVLCCSKCSMFQVHHRLKSKNWVCKVCSCKQSVLKVFAEGAAQECRKVVQKLNKQGALRQMTMHERELQWNPNKDLPNETISMSEDDSTSVRNSDTTDPNEHSTIQSQEISYRLHPYAKPSVPQTKISNSNKKDISIQNSTTSSQTNPFSPLEESHTDSSQRFTSKWDIYL